jgi:ABC-2 type transport system permease protein
MFLQAAILDSSQSVLSALPVVKKIYFPRELLPLSNVISNFVHFLLAFVVFFLYLVFVYFRNPETFPLQKTAVWLPVLMLITLTLGTGLAFFASALNTFYEDVKYILSVGMYLMFFLCPIIYFVELVANSAVNKPPLYWVYKLYLLNPFAAITIAYRKILLAPVHVPSILRTTDPITGKLKEQVVHYDPMPLDWRYIGATALFSVIVLVWGYAFFNKMKWRFVERP